MVLELFLIALVILKNRALIFLRHMLKYYRWNDIISRICFKTI